MILDKIENFKTYAGIHPQFADVLRYMEENPLQKLPVGKHFINNDGAFASVSEYETRLPADGFIECHRKYIDIQVVALGEEMVGVVPLVDCKPLDYDEVKDFQKLEGEVDYVGLKPGMFAIFFPQDGHMPNTRIGKDAVKVKKIVFKIPVIQPKTGCC